MAEKSEKQLENEKMLKEQLGVKLEANVEKTELELAKEKQDAEKTKLEAEAKLKEEESKKKTEEADKLKLEAESNEGVVKITKEKKETIVTSSAETEEDEIDEVKLLKVLSKKAGKEISSLDDFLNPKESKKEPTKEELEKEKENRESSKIAFGLQKNIVSKKDYEGYIADAKNPVELVFKQYLEEQLTEDDSLDAKYVRDEFNTKYGLDREDGSREKKRGLKEIGVLAENIIKATYPNVFKLENEYSKFENDQKNQSEYKQNITSKAPQYKKDVEDAFNDVKTIKVKFSEKEEYSVEIDDEIINEYKSQFLNEDYAEKMIANGWTKELIEQTAKNAVIVQNLENIVKGVSERVLLKREKGLKGVQPNKEFAPRKVLSESELKKVDQLKKQLGVEVENN